MENFTHLLEEWNAKMVALDAALQDLVTWPPTVETVQRRQELETQLLEVQQAQSLLHSFSFLP